MLFGRDELKVTLAVVESVAVDMVDLQAVWCASDFSVHTDVESFAPDGVFANGIPAGFRSLREPAVVR